MNFNEIRISKYNPLYRDVDDKYSKIEWTSISDIGKDFDSGKLSEEVYIKQEKLYVDAIKILMKELKVDNFKLVDVEKHVYHKTPLDTLKEKEVWDSLSENLIIAKQDADIVIQLILREKVWAKLISEKLTIHFGYDFYVYSIAEGELKEAIKQIQQIGLYVEIKNSPYK